MNNPFHRAAVKAFETIVIALQGMDHAARLEAIFSGALEKRFEKLLESQARAFDACKAGTEISMATLAHEMMKALSIYRTRVKLDGNHAAAERAFNDHMKPHFEIRLW